jgi:hypothetical protein
MHVRSVLSTGALLRWIIAIVILGGIVMGGIALSGMASVETTGIQFTTGLPTVATYARVKSLTSSAAAAGVRVGDRLRFATPHDADKLRARIRGTEIHLARPDGSIIGLPLAPTPIPPPVVVLLTTALSTSLLGLLLIVRAWADVRARYLAVGFAYAPYVVAQNVLSGPLLAVASVLGDTLQGVGLIALTYFTTSWSATPHGAARFLRRIVVIAGCLYSIAWMVLDISFASPPPELVPFARMLNLLNVVMVGGILAGFVLTIPRAQGTERRRLAWIAVTMLVSLTPIIAFFVLATFVRLGPLPVWIALTGLAAPFGFGYSMLRHRLVDVGFALNRAAVFAATTGSFVGLFGGLQWAVDHVLVQATATQNFVAQMAIAVAVLYVVRALRVKTEAAVATLFFAEHRRRIDAIRGLAREIDAVENVDALPQFAIDQLRAHASIDATIYVEATDTIERTAGTLGPKHLSRDSPTVVSLRASVAPVPIRAESEMIGAIAFPLAVRGRLRGVLVCALPAGDAEFAPDETDALERFAARIAIARDDLLAQALRQENEALRQRLTALEPDVTRLPSNSSLGTE